MNVEGTQPGPDPQNFMFSHWKANITILQESPAPLTRCDKCSMHIPEDRLEKHKQTSRCDIATEMHMRSRDVDFSLYGMEGMHW